MIQNRQSHREEYGTMKSVQLKESVFLSGASCSPVSTAVADALSWVPLSPPSPAPGLHGAARGLRQVPPVLWARGLSGRDGRPGSAAHTESGCPSVLQPQRNS